MSGYKDGGAVLAATLSAAGVDHAFVLHGGHLEALFRGCVSEGIKLVDFRHEAAAGHAADAYARTSGKLGVCMATAGPGFTNAITAMVNAKLDGSPVLFIIGAPPLREQLTNEMQGGFDQIAMASEAVKWSVRVNSTDRIPDVVALAIRKAMNGIRGPVLVEVPIDVLHMKCHVDVPIPDLAQNLIVPSAPDSQGLDKALHLLSKAKRPVIIAGMEAGIVADADLFRQFAEQTGIPVIFKAAADGLLPSGHRCHAGPISSIAGLTATGTERPDVVMLYGARLGMWLAGRSGAVVPHAAQLIAVTASADDIGKIRMPDIPLIGNLNSALGDMLASGEKIKWPDFSQWRDEIAASRRMLDKPPEQRDMADGMHPYHAVKVVMEACGSDAVYAFDGGESVSWTREALEVDHARRVAAPGYLGCLGNGTGFAIGAQVANPGLRTVLISGDGAFGFNIQELDTMVRHDLPVIIFVMNNRIWGMSKHGQNIMYGDNYSVVSDLKGTNYADIGAAFGCFAMRVDRCDEIRPAVEAAIASGRPAVIELMLADVVHSRTITSVSQGDDSKEITIPYYENIPLSPYVGAN